MAYSPELQAQFVLWRQKAAAGTLTLEEQREIILALRGSRRSAATASVTVQRQRAKKEVRSAEDMLKELL